MTLHSPGLAVSGTNREVSADEQAWLTEQFEAQRPRLRGVAYRLLGSVSEADDAVQDAWLRASRAGADGVENVAAWLTTVVARVCLNMLRKRRSLPEPVAGPAAGPRGGAAPRTATGTAMPDPIVWFDDAPGPEEEALLADAVGLALAVVVQTLTPPERLAFVLHDLFAVPFEDIAPVLGRTVEATRQLASRGRRRVRDAPMPDGDLGEQRRVVDAFFAAARDGDLEALVAVLDPDVVLRADLGPTLRGATAVAAQATRFAHPERTVQPAVVNGAAGAVIRIDGRPVAVMAFTVVANRIVALDTIIDRPRLAELLER
jgi:RNA polymerase sigma-70 factor (ECF subfamily)